MRTCQVASWVLLSIEFKLKSDKRPSWRYPKTMLTIWHWHIIHYTIISSITTIALQQLKENICSWQTVCSEQNFAHSLQFSSIQWNKRSLRMDHIRADRIPPDIESEKRNYFCHLLNASSKVKYSGKYLHRWTLHMSSFAV